MMDGLLMSSTPYNTLIVNTVGEPGSGKTTLSFWLSQALKRSGVVTEFVPEVVKYECFEEAGRARVRSGQFDFRYLMQQTRLLRPLLGNVEVVINDGAYELSYFYGQKRIAPHRLPLFRHRIDELRAHTNQHALSWFVMPKREHPYELDGRNETEAQAWALREELSNVLVNEFEVAARPIVTDQDRQQLVDDILRHVRSERYNRVMEALHPAA